MPHKTKKSKKKGKAAARKDFAATVHRAQAYHRAHPDGSWQNAVKMASKARR